MVRGLRFREVRGDGSDASGKMIEEYSGSGILYEAAVVKSLG
jgi:hypothetical protein